MSGKNQNRREFIKDSAKTGLVVSTVLSGLTAKSYARVPGANERIRVGLIGCGGRNMWHNRWLYRTAEAGENVEVVAGADVWDQKREHGAAQIQEVHEVKPKTFKHYQELLEQDDIHAVVIATPDHQHCAQVRDAVGAGKDVYVEKPLVLEMSELNKTYDVVNASDRIVQNGSQGRSSQGARATKKFIQEGGLGKVFRIEECRSHYQPYWNHYAVPGSEAETDWKAFLMHAPDQPFNADAHGHWMGYRPFSNGTVGGWMTHMSDFIHYVTDCGMPLTAVAQGGIYSPTSVPGRSAPDNVTAIVEYAEGFCTSCSTHFGSGANDYDIWFGEKGIMRTNGPDGNSGGINARVSGTGSEHPDKLPDDERTLDEIPQPDHMRNWVQCIRSRKQPNAHMEYGYMQGVACVMADMALVEGRKMRFDPATREVVPA